MQTILDTSKTQIGLAYWPGISEFLADRPGLVDYVEIPFEQLRHSPDLLSIQNVAPLLLHCASMSIAGFIPPTEETINSICLETQRTRSAWIGEHLAFVSADGIKEEADRDIAPTNLTYTLCPQLSEETVERVSANLETLRPRFSVPLILENSPQYFHVPGSTMNMGDFVNAVVSRCNVDLLLDLSHHMITCANTGVDPVTELDRFPLERVVEVHLSGMSTQSGVTWDDHAVPACPEMFDLLRRVIQRANPRAVTIEYNWSRLPEAILRSHIEKTSRILGQI